MKRRISAILFLLFVPLAGCSSTPNTAASSAADSAASSSQPATASPSASATASPNETPSSSTVAGGTATDFCGAFKEIQAVSEAPSGDVASLGAQFRAAASDMRTFAPAEIEKAANTYADVMDNIGKAAADGTFDEASLSKAVSDGMAGNAEDMATVAIWVANNCEL